jgi:hypothetical protein
MERQQSMREMCAEIFKDFEFGLRLVPSGDALVLPRAAVEAPDKFLSDLVVRAYRDRPPDETSAGSPS